MKTKKYSGENLREIAYPVGGIGTGTISIGGWGNLRDFEIMNKPAKGYTPERTFLCVYAKPEKEKGSAKALQGPVKCGLSYPHGYPFSGGAGLPHFAENSFEFRFPFGIYDFKDKNFCLNASLEVFNPFIPLNSDDSGLPCAIFIINLENKTNKKVHASAAFSIENITSHPEKGNGLASWKQGNDKKLSGIFLTQQKADDSTPSMALSSPAKNVRVQTSWQRGKWFDSYQRFWESFSEKGRLEENDKNSESPSGQNDISSICISVNIKPKEKISIPVFLTWSFPIFQKYFDEDPADAVKTSKCGCENPKPSWKNHYAVRFKNAWDTAEYINRNFVRLYQTSGIFSQILYSSSLSEDSIDAIAANLIALRSTSVIMLENGTLYGFEGCGETSGCCHGTCSHVWNYAQSHAYLFPALAQKIRETDYEYNMNKEGHVNFRSFLPPKKEVKHNFHAAADGQMGGIIQIYREWRLSGDDKWLADIWKKARTVLEYAWKFWDKDKDGVMEGIQHNTYDVEFHGANTMISSLYLTALKCAEIIERHLGDDKKAEEYAAILERGQRWIDSKLFNGEHYIQKVNKDAWKLKPDNLDKEYDALFTKTIDPKLGIPKYQYLDGCLSDQLIGEWYASMLHLSPVLNKINVMKTLRSIYRNNFKKSLIGHCNTQRIYALDDEGGLLLCTWKNLKNKPTHPFPYSDEVWTGIEYQVASHLIMEGMVKEGETVMAAARKRHNGLRRNPFNEFECGNHYVRPLSSYALMLAYSGFDYFAPDKYLAFSPAIAEDNYSFLFTTASCWGQFRKIKEKNELRFNILLAGGYLELNKLTITGTEKIKDIKSIRFINNTREISADVEINRNRLSIIFDEPAKLYCNDILAPSLSIFIKE